MKLKTKMFLCGLVLVGSGYIFSKLISKSLNFNDFNFEFEETDERDWFT